MIIPIIILSVVLIAYAMKLFPILKIERELYYYHIEKVEGYVIQISEDNIPEYEYCIMGKGMKKFKGKLKYKNLKVGQKVNVLYHKDTEESWVENDIRIIKKSLIIPMAVIGIILSVLLMVEFNDLFFKIILPIILPIIVSLTGCFIMDISNENYNRWGFWLGFVVAALGFFSFLILGKYIFLRFDFWF